MRREPRSTLVLAAIGGVVGILLAAAHVTVPRGAHLEDLLVALLLVGFAVQPCATLGHELGHALAALLLGGRPSLIVVGRGPFLRIQAEPTLILFSVLPTRGVPFAGICRYNPVGLRWRSIALIALAGPAATLLELSATLLIAPEVWRSGALAQMLIIWTGIWLTSSLIVNLWPRGGVPRPGTDQAFRRDGDLARYAYARHQATTRAA